jgi:hypothetical protein
METQQNTTTVLDYCQGLQTREFMVDRRYQRSDRVWPSAAQSFLIETILLNFPVPKMSIHQKLDVEARKVVKNIVDGQQRSKAILDFYEGKLRLGRANISDDFAGKMFADLDDQQQAQFMNYGLNFDVFVGATDEDVREVFRRMNSFTVPLNPEEKRHSEYQGAFKWYIHDLSRDFDMAFETSGVLTLKQLHRMQDCKLLTEVIKAMVDGITTTTAAQLNAFYKKNDAKFDRQAEIDEALRAALTFLFSTEELRGTPLTKPYNVYSLLLAYMQSRAGWVIDGDVDIPVVEAFDGGDAAYNLSVLAEAAETKGEYDGSGQFEVAGLDDFIDATTEKTNTAAQRTTRFAYFLAALA